MEPEQKKKLAIGAGVFIVLIFGSWLAFGGKGSGQKADNAQGIKFVCQNASCKNEFTLSQSEVVSFSKNHPGQFVKCPKCGSTDVIEELAKSRRDPSSQGS